MATTNLRASLKVMIDLELLPRCMQDVPGTDRFADWKFTGPTLTIQGDYQCVVTAFHRGKSYYRSFILAPHILEFSPVNIVRYLDNLIINAVRELVEFVHLEGAECTNPACTECYS